MMTSAKECNARFYIRVYNVMQALATACTYLPVISNRRATVERSGSSHASRAIAPIWMKVCGHSVRAEETHFR